MQTAIDSIILFATNDKIARTVHRAETEPALWPGTLERRSMYIIIDDVKLELYAPLLRLITAQCLEYLSMRPNGASPNILLCLDEFASLGKLDIIPALRKLRKKNVRLMILTQSLADLELIYGREERRAIMENVSYKAVMAASDTETQKYFSDLAGEIETVRNTYSENGISQTEQREKRIFPEEFAKLGEKLVLFHPAGVHRLRKAFYFKRW
jgi:type IV secretory pathway TraG/TraD family ATPase VirD4